MNRTLKEATVRRHHYETHEQPRAHLADFVAARSFARRLTMLSDLTPYEFTCRASTNEPRRVTLDPTLQMPGPKKEALMIRANRKLSSTDVLDVLTDLFILRGPPAFVRSDNGPEFVAKAVRDWNSAVGDQTAFIEPGSPWENNCCESFNGRFRDERIDGGIFHSLQEARILIKQWRRHDNAARPHSALGYPPPAPETVAPVDQRPTIHHS